jgi:hypothetical protein
MEKGNESVRERLLAHLPQATNVAAYREEVAALVARKEKAFSTFRWTSRIWSLLALVFAMWALRWAGTHDGSIVRSLAVVAVFFFLIGLKEQTVIYIRRYQIDLLKEIKQTQVQLLELQASLERGTQR